MNALPRNITAAPTARAALEQAIEGLIALLDALEPDPDLEENGDDEPSLGWTDRGPAAIRDSVNDDREEECEDEGAQCDDEGARDEDFPGLIYGGSERAAQ